jgi:hypothetical protein
MDGLSIRGVLFGACVDILGSTACGAFISSAGQAPPPGLQELALGLAFTLLGGYAAGRVSARAQILNGGLAGGVSALLTIPLVFSAALPVWFAAVAILGSVPAAAAGGYLAS